MLSPTASANGDKYTRAESGDTDGRTWTDWSDGSGFNGSDFNSNSRSAGELSQAMGAP